MAQLTRIRKDFLSVLDLDPADFERCLDLAAQLKADRPLGREAPSPAHVEEEIGDMLFAVSNLARKLGVEPEAALRTASDKFQARFTAMERIARDEGRPLQTRALEDQEALWQRVKREAAAS